MKNFRDLSVWNKAHKTTLAVYHATNHFPKDELFGITSQMRRCSASIAAIIAESCGRQGNGDFQRFLQIAMGSASELEYHVLLAYDLKYLPADNFETLTSQVQEVKRMLAALIRRVGIERNRA